MSRVASMAIARNAMQLQLRASASYYPEAGLASAILSLRLAELSLWRVESGFDAKPTRSASQLTRHDRLVDAVNACLQSRRLDQDNPARIAPG
jgi:hypothetical protein